jgi:acyl-[acyl-carrier-protein]-phospholipid O-acyltransferase/long-chain-fatty-acid--[acyl-carrier-protein] ligase
MKQSESSQARDSLRGFWSLFVTQFQGAFSDNVLKNLVIFMLIGMSMPIGEKHEIGELVGALFSLPFILFSMMGGFLADRFSKRTISVSVKVFEVGVMFFALAGFAWQQKLLNLGAEPSWRTCWPLLGCVFLMGVHSAFFGPSKYGLLPELLPEKKLSWGNGLLEFGTFTAIILGTVAAAFMAGHFRGHYIWAAAILVALAFFGLATSLGITRVPAADPVKKFRANFVRELFGAMRSWRGDRPLLLAVVGNTYFNFLGALLLLNLFFYGTDVLHVTETKIGWLTASLAIGIGLGSVAAGYLSGGKIEYGLVPLGALGLSIVSASLAAPGLSVNAALVRLALLGFAGGFFIVPIAALLQHRPAKEKKGEVLAAANLLSFVGVFLASGAHYLLAQRLQLSPLHIFLFAGVLTLAGAVYALFLLPDALLRFVLWVLTRTLYRIRIEGRDNIPAKGGALFVCNHVSFVDALLLLASTDRRVRFLMFKGHYELPCIKPFARILGVIPISSEQRPREMIKSLQTATDAILAGDVVCIFAEGQITRIGHLLPFRRGFERIMKDVDAPIVPVALDGVWGSIFSFEKGRFLWKLPRRIPYPVTVNYGRAMPHTGTPFEVREAVQELMAEAWKHRRARMKPLHRAFVRTARRHPLRFAMADGQNAKVNYFSALVRTVFLARRLERVWAAQNKVGLLLPPSVPGALVNFSAMLMGKVPVNLNYTLSEETLASCIRQCDIKTVLTSRVFLEKIKLKLPCEAVFLEEVVSSSGFRRHTAPESPEGGTPNPEGASPILAGKLVAFLMAGLLPVGLLERVLGYRGIQQEEPPTDSSVQPPASGLRPPNRLDNLATVIFSSGSTGDPKGVMLSHYNIGSNVEQLEQVLGLNRRDCVLGVLPFFHSFGFTGTLCLPAMLGVGVVYHPNPLDAKAIGPLVREYSVTFLLATPTFMQLYLRGCAAEDFGSLRVVMTGAEKLPDRLAAAFEEKFGIRPLEGYGCTECAPAVAVNTLDFRSAGFRQVGGKRGKIGHPVPGVSVRIVDPQTLQPVPRGQSGLMLVRGPNVMQGYLGRPDKTAEVLIAVAAGRTPAAEPGVTPGGTPDTAPQRWYVTGDIAAIDEDGFLQITDRLSRFSKIGGEMVPHIKVEEQLHELAGVTEQTFVVAGVPDEKKGERLVVLHKLADGPLQLCLEKLGQCDLPNLWKPRADQFFRVEAFPCLGTGKLDLRKIREMAAKFSVQA